MSNSWHENMYDTFFAERSLNSPELRDKAKREVDFLLSILSLKENARVLDVPCGTGRHGHHLAEKGFRVQGVDISPACVKIANHSAPPGFRAELGDMKNLESYRGFDATLNLFSSFGYFSTDEENEQVLQEMVKTLAPGGKLVLNLINKNFLLSIYRPSFWVKTGNLLQVHANSYDPSTSYNEAYITLKDELTGETTLSYHRIRLYSPDEIVRLMERAGLRNITTLSGKENIDFDPHSTSHPYYLGNMT